MKRRMLAAALATLLLLMGHALAISSPDEMLRDPAAETRAEAIGHQLRCLVCQNESVEESNADLAKDLRRIIRTRVVAGDSDSEVIAWMVARYGDFVRLRPPFNAATALLWGSPALALLVGIGAVWLGRRRRIVAPAPLSEAERGEVARLMRP